VRCPRIYTPQALSIDNSLTLAAEASHYLGKVLRMQIGDALILFNGDGCEYPATIAAIDKRTVVVSIEQCNDEARESPLQLHLGIAISKGERMDWIIQKATELGGAHITPLYSERVEVKLQGERAEKKLAHWRGIAIAACEQCGRNRLPQIAELTTLADWLQTTTTDKKFVLHHRAAVALDNTAAHPNSIALLIGPEGGLSETEINAALRREFAPLQLGPRILRTETAPLAAISILQYLWGDLQRRD
jgi:16S rRNA (uracil1498-N3)-methyltransferase